MTTAAKTTAVKLVTVIASFDMEGRVLADMASLGATGYTVSSVNGRGVHGRRHYGVIDGANVRIESLVTPDVARGLLEHLAATYADEPLIAFSQNAEVISATSGRHTDELWQHQPPSR